MGTASAKEEPNLKAHELEEYSKITSFSHAELDMLYKYYMYISASKVDDGVIEFVEFCHALSLPDSLVIRRIFTLFDTNEDGVINFREFIVGLAYYLYETTEHQVKFSFKLLDPKDCGYCSKDDLKAVLTSYFEVMNSFSRALPEVTRKELINSMVDSTFKAIKTENDDRVSYEEYKKLYFQKGFSSKWLLLDLEKLHNYVQNIVHSNT